MKTAVLCLINSAFAVRLSEGPFFDNGDYRLSAHEVETQLNPLIEGKRTLPKAQ